MTNTIYKVNTNFFETPLNKGFQRVLLIEWEGLHHETGAFF